MKVMKHFDYARKNGADQNIVNLPAHFSVWLASAEGRAVPSAKYLWVNWDVEELKERRELRDDRTAVISTLPGWPFPVRTPS